VFAPILIAGWGTNHPMGAAGAGLASTLAIAVGVICLWTYFAKLEHYVALNSGQWLPQPAVWRRILNIGLPAGGEFMMLFVITGAVYWAIRNFGPAAQAGFGIASRVMQAIFLPAMAIAFAAAPFAGQNFGARNMPRVRETFRTAAWLGTAVMVALTLIC
jgi:Na+-driven multidrug efflux pump